MMLGMGGASLSDAGSEQQAPRRRACSSQVARASRCLRIHEQSCVEGPSRVCEGGDTIWRIARARVGIGETLYENAAVCPWIQKWQRRIQRVLTFAPLMVQGRGVFSYSSG